MGFRESLNQKPALIASVVGVLVVAVLFLLGKQIVGGGDPRLGSGKAFYSVDDGQTYFSYDSSNIAPFDYSGKTAVQAFVYSADGGKTRFVGYLQRFTPAGKQKMIEKRKQIEQSKGLPTLDRDLLENTEVKKPGDKSWVKLSDMAQSSRVTAVVDPKNPSASADPVDP